MPIYKIQVRDADGDVYWFFPTVNSVAEAQEFAESRGYIVLQITKPDGPEKGPRKIKDIEYHNDRNATIMAALGLLLIPFAFIAFFQGCELARYTDGKLGQTAKTISSIAIVLWAIGIIMFFVSFGGK